MVPHLTTATTSVPVGRNTYFILSIFAVLALLPMHAVANPSAGDFEYNGYYYYYNGGLPGNNSYCLYATPPADAADAPVLDPQSISGATEAGMCGGGIPAPNDFTYAGYYYYYNGGLPGNNAYCLYATPPADAAGPLRVLNPQSIPGATEVDVCGGGTPPAGDFTYAGNDYYYNGGLSGNNAYCLYASPPTDAAQLPVMNPQSIYGATEAGMCGGGGVQATPFTYGANYYYYNGSGTYCQYAAPPVDAADVPVINPQSIAGAQLSGTCGPATLQTFSGTSGTPIAGVAFNHGVMDFQLNGNSSFGLGWGTNCPDVVLQQFQDMVGGVSTGGTGFPTVRIRFFLGDNVYGICGPPTPSWNGGDPTVSSSYNFTYLDSLLAEGISANPNTRIILQVALDGSLGWVYLHPDCVSSPLPLPNPKLTAVPNPAPAAFACLSTAEQYQRMVQGVPDYLSAQWVTDSTNVINALVSHIQAVGYGTNVVSYELMNGSSLDNGYPISYTSPGARMRFQSFLAQTYSSADALTAAWQQSGLTFPTAQPVLAGQGAPTTSGGCPTIPSSDPARATRSQIAPLFIPSAFRAYADTRQFTVSEYQQVTFNFADAVKWATQGQAAVGVRSGEFLQGVFCNEQGAGVQFRTPDYYSYPSIDFFEVWEHYYSARRFGVSEGSGEPLMPVQGMAAFNKLYVVQNDFRVAGPVDSNGNLPAGWDTEPDNGYDPTFAASIQKVRRVFVNSLVNGMSEYLWQMSYWYDQPQLIPEWQQEQQIAAVAMNTDRSRVSDLVYVLDPGLGQYLADAYVGGSGASAPTTQGDLFYDQPGLQTYLVQFPMQTWARAGVPYDTIFLSQLASAKSYKVYVFYHTIGLSAAQVESIQAILQANNAVGIFVYADGMIDGMGNADPNNLGANISALTNMPIIGTTQQRKATLIPSSSYVGGGGTVGDLARWSFVPAPIWSDNSNDIGPFLFPSFSIGSGTSAKVLATYSSCGGLTIGPNQTPDCTTTPAGAPAIAEQALPNGGDIIYSATPYLPPGLMRYALHKAGGFQYSNTEDNIFVDQSFVGVHTMDGTQGDGSVITTGTSGVPSWTIQLSFPTATPLYDVFNHVEYPANTQQAIPVVANHTYLFYRGTRVAWQALGGQ